MHRSGSGPGMRVGSNEVTHRLKRSLRPALAAGAALTLILLIPASAQAATKSVYFDGSGVIQGLMKNSGAGYVAEDEVYGTVGGTTDGWVGSEVTQIIQSGKTKISRAEGPLQQYMTHTQYVQYADTRAYCNWSANMAMGRTGYLKCWVTK